MQGRRRESPSTQRRETDMNTMVRESSKTPRHHRRYRQRDRSDLEIDTRNDDSYSPRYSKEERRSHRTSPEDGGISSEKRRVRKESSDMTHWSSLSVRVAMAVMKANGSEKVAEKAANAVLEAGKKNQALSLSSLGALATKVSVVVLEAGGSQEAAAAVTMAIINGQDFAFTKPKVSREKKLVTISEDNASKKTKPKPSRTKETDKDIKSTTREMEVTKSLSSKSSQDTASSVTPSMAVKKRVLKEKEDEIARKTKALEEAERLSLQKEKELERMIAAARLHSHERNGIEKVKTDKSVAGSIKHIQSCASKTSMIGISPSDSPSIQVKQRELKEKEDKLAQMTKAIEDAERVSLQKEKELRERIAEQTARLERSKRDNDENDDESRKTYKSKESSKSVKRSNSIRTDPSFSSTASMKSRLQQVKEKQDEITRKNKEMGEATLLQQQKEKEMNERNLQMDKEISDRLAALDAAEAALQERSKNVQLEKERKEARLKLEQREQEIKDKMAALDAAEAALRDGGKKKQVGFTSEVMVKPALSCGIGSIATSSSGSAESTECGSLIPSQCEPPQGGNKGAFEELTGRLYSMFDPTAWAGSHKKYVLDTVTPTRSFTPSTTKAPTSMASPKPMPVEQDLRSEVSYSTHASDSTGIITNKTGDVSRATWRTGISALTEDQRTWEMSALAKETGLQHNGNALLQGNLGNAEVQENHVKWQHQGSQGQTNVANTQMQNNHGTNDLLNKALQTAMNQYSAQTADPPRRSSGDSLRSADQSSSKHPSSKQSPIKQPSSEQLSGRQYDVTEATITTASSKSSSHAKRRMNFFSFSKKQSGVGKKPVSKQRYLI